MGNSLGLTAFVFARGGSEGVPRKNLQVVGGVSLLGRAIQRAFGIPEVSAVVVSTDDVEIAREAEQHGAHVPWLRPKHLAGSFSPEVESWKHAISMTQDSFPGVRDVFLSIPTTAPLAGPQDAGRALQEFRKGAWDAVVTVTEARRHPAFNMVRRSPTGQVKLAADSISRVHRRQDAEAVFDICTVAYVARSSYVLGCEYLLEGRVGSIVVPQERSLDVDTSFDLRVADLLLTS